MDYNQEQYFRMQQSPMGAKMPFYMSYPMQSIYMTEMEYESDMERMKELYPREVKQIQKYVDDACDKMEYDGSLMFDEYPDRVMLRRVCEQIMERIMMDNDNWENTQPEDVPMNNTDDRNPINDRSPMNPMNDMDDMGDEMLEMTSPRPGRGHRPPRRPVDPGMRNLIEVLLYNEMFKRRCRHRRCRRWW